MAEVSTKKDGFGRIYFTSKRDSWLAIVLWVGALSCVAGGVYIILAAGSTMFSVGLLIILLGTAFLILWILYGTNYTLFDQVLDIRSGPFKFRVPLEEVTSVEPSQDPISSPACSLDRLLIRYGRRQILISPKDRLEFLDELARRDTQLVREGDRMIRRGGAKEN